MNDNQSSLVFKLILLYAALSVILGIGFGIDIAGWWAIPAYKGLAGVIENLIGLFR